MFLLVIDIIDIALCIRYHTMASRAGMNSYSEQMYDNSWLLRFRIYLCWCCLRCWA